MSTALVTTIYRYPVKSMMGETLSEADIGGAGIPGDRSWAVRDEKRGGIRGGKKIPQLMTLAAQSGSAAPLITAPDGDSASASSESINEWLSDKHKLLLLPQLVSSFEKIASDSYLFADSRKKRRGGTAGMVKNGQLFHILCFTSH